MAILKKSELRRIVKERRKTLSATSEASMNEAIFERLKRIEPLAGAAAVYCYMDCRHEAGTGRLLSWLWGRGVRTAFPRVEGEQIYFYYAASRDEFVPGCMGILEPAIFCEPAGEQSAPVVAPGVAFDTSLRRVGYGGGYYDRFFEREQKHLKIGIAFEFQVFSRVPQDKFDCRLDLLVTPEHIYRGG